MDDITHTIDGVQVVGTGERNIVAWVALHHNGVRLTTWKLTTQVNASTATSSRSCLQAPTRNAATLTGCVQSVNAGHPAT